MTLNKLLNKINKYEINKKFKRVYLELFETDLVKFNIMSESSIKEFCDKLNEATHKTTKERNDYLSIKELYSNNEEYFNKLIRNNYDYRYLVLYTNGMFITEMLKINEYVTILSKISIFYVNEKIQKRQVKCKVINNYTIDYSNDCFEIDFDIIITPNELNINLFKYK